MQCFIQGAVDSASALAARPDIASWATVFTVITDGVMAFDTVDTQNRWVNNT